MTTLLSILLGAAIGIPLGALVGARLPRAFPLYERGTVLVANVGPTDEFLVAYSHRSSVAYHRCKYVGEIFPDRMPFEPGQILTFSSRDLRPHRRADPETIEDPRP